MSSSSVSLSACGRLQIFRQVLNAVFCFPLSQLKNSLKCGKYKSYLRMVGKFVLASFSQNHRIAEAGRNLHHLTYPRLHQDPLEQVAQARVHSGLEYLHGDIHLNRLSHEMKQA